MAGAAGANQADLDMVAHYQAFASDLAMRVAPGYAVAYDQGGKTPVVTPFETTGKVTVTTYMPAPAMRPSADSWTHTKLPRPGSRRTIK